jgi:hypothetical protein
MKGWKISNHSTVATIKSDIILQPDSFLLICSSAAADAYSTFGPVVSVTGFPSLDNDGDTISLQSPEGITIHAVTYNKSSYQNEIKSNGGWSLEMIVQESCNSYNNWKASSTIEVALGSKILSMRSMQISNPPHC